MTKKGKPCGKKCRGALFFGNVFHTFFHSLWKKQVGLEAGRHTPLSGAILCIVIFNKSIFLLRNLIYAFCKKQKKFAENVDNRGRLVYNFIVSSR